jgi:IclR family transcriptional regulator, pca regulon regulatory protein
MARVRPPVIRPPRTQREAPGAGAAVEEGSAIAAREDEAERFLSMAVDTGRRGGIGGVAPRSELDPGTNDPNFMTSLARGLSVIRAFDGRHPNLTIAEVAKITGLSRAAARRCLYTLARLDYAGSDGRTFFLRPKILALGYAYLSSAPFAATIEPVLERVSETLHESASAGVLDEDEVVYVARVATKRIISEALNVGSRLPAHCTSMGRVLLAQLPMAALDAYLGRAELKPFTARTITSRDELRRIIDQVRHRGYALVDQELEIGLRSIAVPIRNAAGVVVAAMNVGAQAARVSRRDMEGRFLPVLRAAADEVRVLPIR